jgi:hypothetical protein
MSDALDAGAVAPVIDKAANTAATPENVATPATGTETAQEVEPQAEDRKFSQAELDSIIQKEKAKAEAKAERRAMRAYKETLERLVPQQPQQTQQQADSAPKREQFATDEQWLDARDEWRDAKRSLETSQRQRQEQSRSLSSRTESIYAEAAKEPGFDREAFDELPLTQPIAAALIESDAPAKLMAHLSAHPEEVERIAALSPARQAAEIGKLEAKIASAPKVSKAPPPITPIGGTRGGDKDPAQMTDAEFAKWRKAQIAQRN